MKTTIFKQEFKGNEVCFDLSSGNVMVNATQLANICGKEIELFFQSAKHWRYLDVCLANGNQLNIAHTLDVYRMDKKGDIYMHHFFARTYVEWLGPSAQVWFFIAMDGFRKLSYEFELPEIIFN